MNADVERILQDNGPVIRAEQMINLVGRYAWEWALETQRLTRLHPGVYLYPQQPLTRHLRRRAALAYAGPGSVISHLDALDLHGLDLQDYPRHELLHLSMSGQHRRRTHRRESLIIHHFLHFNPDVDSRQRQGLATIRLEDALLQSWPLLDEVHQPDRARRPFLEAVQRRMTTSERIVSRLPHYPTLTRRKQLLLLLSLLNEGCHSELEILGLHHVFMHPSLPPSQGQVKLALPHGGNAYLDRYFPEHRVAVELDGTQWHQGQRRDHDLDRDTRLAALGVTVLRFSFKQVVEQPDLVRQRLLDVLAATPASATPR